MRNVADPGEGTWFGDQDMTGRPRPHASEHS
jgi:hypothetical protein